MTTIWNEQAMLAEIGYRREQMLRAARREQRDRTRRTRRTTRDEVPRRRWSLRGSEAWPAAR